MMAYAEETKLNLLVLEREKRKGCQISLCLFNPVLANVISLSFNPPENRKQEVSLMF